MVCGERDASGSKSFCRLKLGHLGPHDFELQMDEHVRVPRPPGWQVGFQVTSTPPALLRSDCTVVQQARAVETADEPNAVPDAALDAAPNAAAASPTASAASLAGPSEEAAVGACSAGKVRGTAVSVPRRVRRVCGELAPGGNGFCQMKLGHLGPHDFEATNATIVPRASAAASKRQRLASQPHDMHSTEQPPKPASAHRSRPPAEPLHDRMRRAEDRPQPTRAERSTDPPPSAAVMYAPASGSPNIAVWEQAENEDMQEAASTDLEDDEEDTSGAWAAGQEQGGELVAREAEGEDGVDDEEEDEDVDGGDDEELVMVVEACEVVKT